MDGWRAALGCGVAVGASTYATFDGAAEAQMAEFLAIPDGISQIVLLRVTYTIGTDFKLVNREPLGQITYLDSWESPWPT
jgi:hypothetical protein